MKYIDNKLYANKVNIKDVNNNYTSKNVEGALEEIANDIYYITPKNFNDDIQNTIEYAFTNKIPCVKLEGKKYVLTDSILLYSNMTLEGVKGETILELKGVNKPIIAKKGSILGNTHIKNIKVTGDQTQSDNHGIVLNDYYSSIIDCEAEKCGGYGFYISENGASGTLVENRIENCIARLCKNTSFYLGSSSNKITDGFLFNCISYGTMSNSALYIGSSAGWNINGLHTYCHAEAVAMIILNSYHTFVNNIYIEDFNEIALDFSKCQQGLNISNITTNFKAGSTNSAIIHLNHSTSHENTSNVNISNITINSGGNLTNCSIYSGDDSNYTAYVSNTAITGDKEGLSLIKEGLSLPRYKIISDARVTGKLYITKDITEDERGILYNGYKIPVYKSGKINAGNTEQTILIKLPYIQDFEKIIANFKIYTSQWDDGAGRIKYSTELLISAKTGTSCQVYKNDLIQSVGFSSEPSFVFDKVNETLTVKFIPSETDGVGMWVCNMYQL